MGDLSKGTGGAAGAGVDDGAGGGVIFGGTGGSVTGAAAATGAGGVQNVCGGQAFKAEAAPVDMYIMFDQSSSMGDPLPNSNPPVSWWQAAQQAVTNFVNDPRAQGMQAGSPAMTVGIQYFPLDGIAPQSCMANYQMPEVELGVLPGNSAAVAASIQMHQPTAFTPTAAALNGAITHMKAWGPAHLGHAPVVVLVTDGFPTECDPQDITDIAQIAKTAFETDPPVRTFVVGFNLGPGGANLKELATAGGTNAPFLINGGDIGSQFVDAMLSISSSQLQCKFDLPKPPDGMSLDINQVAVTYTPSATMVEAQVPKLNGLGDCELNMGDGWFYDSPTNPSKIEVCPGTCSKFAAGVVKTASGCKPDVGMTR
ncbi:MAG TPA: vWA domain-containing protein [Polyangiaceae bacterium]|jgi:hypothetical protein|nr:vWA domain-containing protein [Polyangiaceae bacterium]